MGAIPDPPSPGELRVARLCAALPPLSAVHPFLDLLVSTSHPDPDRRWSGSGELGALEDRMVDPGHVRKKLPELVHREAVRAGELHTRLIGITEAIGEGDEERAVALLLEQGAAEEADARWTEAEAWYAAAHALAGEIGSSRIATALRRMARAARQLGRLEEAGDRYEEAWRQAEGAGAVGDLAVAGIGRGNVAVDQGRWEEARGWYERTLALVGESGDPRRERWQLQQNLAIVHRRTGAFDRARECLHAAGREGRRLEDPDAAVEGANGWGQLLLAQGEARGAELHFREALRHARTPRARVTIRVNLGEALLAQGRALEAGEAARAAESEALAHRIVGKFPEVYRLLAQVAHVRGTSEAAVLLDRTLELIRARGLPAFEEALTLELSGRIRIAEGEVERGRAERSRAASLFRELGMEAEAGRIEDEWRMGEANLGDDGGGGR